MRAFRFVCFSVLALALGNSAFAAISIPTGLNPGDKFRVVFVTSTVRDATSSDIAIYDSFVTQAATNAGLTAFNGSPVTWRVIGSTRSTSAFDQVTSQGDSAIYRMDGIRIAQDNADLFDGLLDASVRYTEFGNVSVSQGVHTGSRWTGAILEPTAFGDENVGFGAPGTVDLSWLTQDDGFATAELNFYAISSEMTVGAVPEPASLIVWSALAIAGVVAYRRRKAA